MSESKYKYVKKNRHKIKNRLYDAFGGACGICGYNKFPTFDLHHLDPNEKEFTIASWGKHSGWDALVKEARKCVLLCANCHREVHVKHVKVPEDIKRFDETFSKKPYEDKVEKVIEYTTCLTCGSSKVPLPRKYCSQKCFGLDIHKIVWDDNTFEIIKKAGALTAASKILGVSDTCIKRWLLKNHPEYKHPFARRRKF